MSCPFPILEVAEWSEGVELVLGVEGVVMGGSGRM